MTLRAVRYWLPVALIAAGVLSLFVIDDSDRFEAFSMLVGSGLSVALLNVLFRYGAKGDQEREAEDAAREYYAQHGRWPDEER
ncbi:MAG TPA: hypothetical protein VFX80_12150 [Solirubrobacteraceae bacterium]|nr:hypothetical protein [Solirubrobacteraceae bacterium]